MVDLQHSLIFANELLKDEKIVWTGQPDPSVNLNRRDIFLVPFSALWGGFALFWTWAVVSSLISSGESISESNWIIFVLFGVVFSLLGLYFMIGRLLYKKWKKRRTYYALTNRRALILITGLTKTFSGAFLDSIPVINKSVRSSGNGTVTFGNTNWLNNFYDNTGMDFFSGFSGSSTTAFFDIANADRVYDMANDLRS